MQQEGWGGFFPWEREAVRRIVQLPPLKQAANQFYKKRQKSAKGGGGEEETSLKNPSLVIKQFT